ncbi:MAG: 50S ribosomal protein L9 [Acidimicrobiia bacterium]|nr:50S ribosomal protein L9 [Acidimicrobiia bacterium]
MKLILVEDVQDLGAKGDVVDVADGYARNYLVPKRKAVKATRGAIAQAEAVRSARVEAATRIRGDAEQIAQMLAGTRVVVAARAGDEGRLFGSVAEHDIIEAIKRFTGVDVERKIVSIPAPIKEIGLHEVTLRPHPEVEFNLTLDVIPA